MHNNTYSSWLKATDVDHYGTIYEWCVCSCKLLIKPLMYSSQSLLKLPYGILLDDHQNCVISVHTIYYVLYLIRYMFQHYSETATLAQKVIVISLAD